MFIVNLERFDIFYFKGLTTGRLVYLGKAMVTDENIWGHSNVRKLSDEEISTEVVKVGKMLSINLLDVGVCPVP